MDNDSGLHRFILSFGYSGRIQQVSKDFRERIRTSNFFQLSENLKRILAFLGLLITSILLGFWANTLSEKDAVQRWEKSHYPSFKIIKNLFLSEGFRLLTDSRISRQIYRTLPAEFEGSNWIWMSPDFNWMALQLEKHGVIQIQVFCLECSKLPQSWSPLSIGWKQVETALETVELDRQRRLGIGPSKKKTSSVYRDLREIRY